MRALRAPFFALFTIAVASGAWAWDAPPVVKTRLALDALGTAAVAWQQEFPCNGCHKQPLTIAALVTAAENRYEPPAASIVPALTAGMLNGNAGQNTSTGCFSINGNFITVGTAFGGRGLEALESREPAFQPRLVAAANCLLTRQVANGNVPSDHTELPPDQGDYITTAQSISIWDRVHEITANAVYGQARDQAVAWLRTRVGAVEASPASFTTQDKTMLLAGLGRSGAGPSDPDVVRMRNVIAAEQLPDRSWKLASATAGGNAYATGQAVWALRIAGYDRTDPAVDTGTQWLLDTQETNGRWPALHWQGTNPPSLVGPSMFAAMALATYPSPLATLRLQGGADTLVEWDAVEGAEAYDLLRGSLDQLQVLGGVVDLGSTTCLEPATTATSVADDDVPDPGAPFFYLMRLRWGSNVDIWGRSSNGLVRVAGGGCP